MEHLTKREIFAMAALKGAITTTWARDQPNAAATTAVELADCLIEALKVPRAPPVAKGYEDKSWQGRVLEEKNLLDCKRRSLARFITSLEFLDLDKDEQDRLIKQAKYMNVYSQILGERIDAFTKGDE